MVIRSESELDDLKSIVAELGSLKYFPSEHEEGALVAITTDVANMVQSLEDARWLVARMRQLYNDWPGPRELRAVYCSERKPADGRLAKSEVYPDGFPKLEVASPLPPPCPQCAESEGAAWRQTAGGLGRCDCARGRALAGSDKEKKLLLAPVRKREPWTDEELAEAAALINRGQLPEARAKLGQTELPSLKRITQADIDRAVAERKSKGIA